MSSSGNEIDKIVIRTLFNHESRFIVLPSNEFSLDNFMRTGKLFGILYGWFIIKWKTNTFSVQVEFQINGDLRINASLRDNLNTPIPPIDFCTIVQNYKNSGSFYVLLEYDVIQQNPTTITVEVKFELNCSNLGPILIVVTNNCRTWSNIWSIRMPASCCGNSLTPVFSQIKVENNWSIRLLTFWSNYMDQILKSHNEFCSQAQ